VLDYDVLVVATGSRLVPEETEGLTGPGWMEKVFTFYDLAGATALEAQLATFDGGRLVVPVHSGAAYVGASPGLGDDLDFVFTRRPHPPVEGEAERVRDRRRREPADLEGRVSDAFRG
jgi:hypothetical protein